MTRPRPDTRGAPLGDRYAVALVTTQPWAWSGFMRRLMRAATAGEPGDLVWLSPWGCPLTAEALAPRVRRAAARAGLGDVRLYDLRKFGASACTS